MLTVIIPAYNANADLPRALASLQAQTFEDWTCVVVDDGSEVPLAPIVEGFADPRMHVVRHRVNRGRGAARQTGLDHVVTPLVAWQDADDWSYPTRFERQLQALRDEPAADLVSTSALVTGVDERPVGVTGVARTVPTRLAGSDTCPVVHASLMFRASVLDRVAYNPKFRTSEDHDFMMRALREYAFVTLPESLYVYREEQSRSFKKYARATWTRLEVAATLARASALDRLALVGGHAAKLGLHAGCGALGLRDQLVARSFAPTSLALIAEYDECRAIVDRWVQASPAEAMRRAG